MPMLAGKVSLFDIDDLELLVRRSLSEWMRRRNATLNEHDFEDLLQHCIVAAWEAASGWQPNRGWSASKIAWQRTQLRAVDWYRKRYHDTRSPKPELPLSLDGEFDRARDDESGERTRLEYALAASGRHSPEARTASDLGLRD